MNSNNFNQTTNSENQTIISNKEQIMKKEISSHYLCTKCLIFPFIELLKDKNI